MWEEASRTNVVQGRIWGQDDLTVLALLLMLSLLLFQALIDVAILLIDRANHLHHRQRPLYNISLVVLGHDDITSNADQDLGVQESNSDRTQAGNILSAEIVSIVNELSQNTSPYIPGC